MKIAILYVFYTSLLQISIWLLNLIEEIDYASF